MKAILLNMPNRAKTVAVAEWIADDEARFSELMNLVFEYPGAEMVRTAWAMNFVLEKHHHMLGPYWDKLIAYLKTDVHNAFGRNLFRILGWIPLPESHLGELTGMAFDFLCDPQSEVAIRSNCIIFLMRVVEQEPDLAQELKLVLEDGLEYETKAAFVGRARKALKKLSKMKKH